MIVLLVSVLAVTVAGSSAIHSRPYSRFGKRDVNSSQTFTWHNAAVKCGGNKVVKRNTRYCQRELHHLTIQGYPWSPPGRQENPIDVQNVTDNLRDALDSLNHVCYIQDRSRRCLREHDIQDFCVASTTPGRLQTELDIQFICHQRQRDENLVRSLQCLHKKRLLMMLYFHIANRCGGFVILDDIMRRMKNAYFYRLNVKPIHYSPFAPQLYCLPKHLITTCIRPLIDDYCGAMSADLVEHYILYVQDWFDQTFRSVGLSHDICDYDVSSNNNTLDIPRVPQLHGKLGVRSVSERCATLRSVLLLNDLFSEGVCQRKQTEANSVWI